MDYILNKLHDFILWFQNYGSLVFGPEEGGYPRYNYWIKGITFSLEITFLAALIGLIVGIVIGVFIAR